MNVGTKSVLFGVHAFWLHPWIVAIAWWRLYGFPWQPWLWALFFVHDIGYLGKPNMDGEEGELHPFTGARILWGLEWWWRQEQHCSHKWGNEALYHSRFLAKKYGVTPSRLCIADKLVIVMEPWWLYLPRAIVSGEVNEYMGLAKTDRHQQEHERVRSDVKDTHMAVRIFGRRGRWYLEVQQYMRQWIAEHKDGREDTWTRDIRKAKTESGVWP